MNKLIVAFKKLDKIDRMILIMIITIFLLLCINISISVGHIMDYTQNKNSGNERWKQVEKIIIDYKDKVDELENIIQQDKIKEIK